MNGGFVKLYGSIVTSSIWVESHETVRVWITMLALADRNGFVQGTAPGLASIARMTLVECEESLEKLASPDRHSRTSDHEGRRIEAVDGGWVLLNHGKYRQIRTQEQVSGAERVKRHRAKKAQGRNTGVTDVTSNDVTHQKTEDREQSTKTTKTLRASWLTPIAAVYEQRMGAGSFPFSKAGKLLKPLIDAQHSGDEIAVRLARYIDGLDDVKYLSLAKFRETFGNYTTAGRNGKANPGLQQMANILGGDRD